MDGLQEIQRVGRLGTVSEYAETPILMLTTGRSGSSMFAGIFAHHGVFTGRNHRPDQYNAKGYYENLDIKKRMKHRFGFELLDPYPKYDPDWASQVRTILRMQGYKYGPWLYKVGARFHALWKDFNPRILKVRRDRDAILESYKRTNFLLSKYSFEQVTKIIDDQREVMESLPGCWLDYELAIEGDFSQLEVAFHYCGLEFDPTITENFIDNTLRHF